jgi:hypothetical protein
MAAVEVKKILALVPKLFRAPYSRIWTSYDKEVDVFTLTSKSQAMLMILSLRMMIS